MNGYLREIDHRYGPRVHILDDPYCRTLLAELCQPQTMQPRLNWLLQSLYEALLRACINDLFPKQVRSIRTRMGAEYRADLLDPHTEVVTVDIARAGIKPSLVCFELLSTVLDPTGVRQDHIVMNRTTDARGAVTGAAISGSKIGGPIEGKFLLFPDPMGATGSSLTEVVRWYREHGEGTPRGWVSLNLIVTPEFLRQVTRECPELQVYALRVDRGLSPPAVLALAPGEAWDQERGLDDHDYIIPGAGGLGEVLNNAVR
ncbi:MAG TPA: uracil phosphoribosyltransferase [Myxococcota bacterium]|nr:uracil phosphoribosyltransferase [Myxococcota bacterium]HQK52399.1 uracil phosphoribosyltransferase [Myxococcota bacterium]